MNEEIIMNMAKPYIKDGLLSYDLFDRIYAMLSLKEQYQVCEILNKNGIELADIDDSLMDSSSTEETLDEKSDLLVDENLFKDKKSDTQYVFFNRDVKQSNDTLIRLIQEGNKQARQDLCVKNEGLVRKYATVYYRYFGNDLEYDDLLQAGYLGVLTAADRFDFQKESAFSTYAIYWVKQSISRQIVDEGYRIRIPVHMMEKIVKMTRLDKEYAVVGLGLKQRIKKIAEDMEISSEEVETLFDIKHQFLGRVSLDTPVGEEEETTLGELIPADESYSIENEIMQKALASALNEVLTTIKPREEKILRLRFGIDDGRPRTLEEIGQELHVTRERIRQIEEKALRKLRHPTRSKKLKDFFNN